MPAFVLPLNCQVMQILHSAESNLSCNNNECNYRRDNDLQCVGAVRVPPQCIRSILSFLSEEGEIPSRKCCPRLRESLPAIHLYHRRHR